MYEIQNTWSQRIKEKSEVVVLIDRELGEDKIQQISKNETAFSFY